MAELSMLHFPHHPRLSPHRRCWRRRPLGCNTMSCQAHFCKISLASRIHAILRLFVGKCLFSLYRPLDITTVSHYYHCHDDYYHQSVINEWTDQGCRNAFSWEGLSPPNWQLGPESGPNPMRNPYFKGFWGYFGHFSRFEPLQLFLAKLHLWDRCFLLLAYSLCIRPSPSQSV